jgi:beta-glucosidase
MAPDPTAAVAYAYAERFGIVHVDDDTLARTPGASARWYSELICRRDLSA